MFPDQRRHEPNTFEFLLLGLILGEVIAMPKELAGSEKSNGSSAFIPFRDRTANDQCATATDVALKTLEGIGSPREVCWCWIRS